LRTALFVALVLALISAPLPAADAVDPELQKGIALVDDGDYDGAILTLDNAARRLAQDKSKANDLSQAYLYLGIAYIGKGHEAAARAKFREAIAQIKDLSLSPDKFPPKVIDIFEAVKEEESRRTPEQAAAAAPSPSPAAPAESKKKGGGKTALIVLGGVAVAGGAVAAAAGGGGGGSSSSSPPPTTLPADSRTVQTFTGNVCGYASLGRQHGTCSYFTDFDVVVSQPGTLDATVTWSDTSIFFEMELEDQASAVVATSSRTSSTTSQLTSAVTPQTACSSCAYRIGVSREDDKGPMDFTLTVKHP
jgi:hypothetical protein